CTLSSRSCAIKFGSGTTEDMRDHLYSNIAIRNSNRGLGIQHRGPGDIENVLFSDITVETRLFTGNWWGQAEPIHVSSLPRTEGGELGTVRNVRFRNVVARGEGGVVLWGTGGNVRNVTLDGVELRLRGGDLADRRGGNLDLRPTGVRPSIEAAEVPGVYARGVADLDCHRVAVAWADDRPPEYYTNAVACEDCEGVEIDGFRGRGGTGLALALRDCAGATVRD
ncbi:MAG: polygalacturonase, partial [Halobacteriaceae archaeon]